MNPSKRMSFINMVKAHQEYERLALSILEEDDSNLLNREEVDSILSYVCEVLRASEVGTWYQGVSIPKLDADWKVVKMNDILLKIVGIRTFYEVFVALYSRTNIDDIYHYLSPNAMSSITAKMEEFERESLEQKPANPPPRFEGIKGDLINFDAFELQPVPQVKREEKPQAPRLGRAKLPPVGRLVQEKPQVPKVEKPKVPQVPQVERPRILPVEKPKVPQVKREERVRIPRVDETSDEDFNQLMKVVLLDSQTSQVPSHFVNWLERATTKHYQRSREIFYAIFEMLYEDQPFLERMLIALASSELKFKLGEFTNACIDYKLRKFTNIFNIYGNKA